MPLNHSTVWGVSFLYQEEGERGNEDHPTDCFTRSNHGYITLNDTGDVTQQLVVVKAKPCAFNEAAVRHKDHEQKE